MKKVRNGGGTLPQREVVQEVRRGKTSPSQAAQPLPGSSCQEIGASLGPGGPHCRAREQQLGMTQLKRPSSNMSLSRWGCNWYPGHVGTSSGMQTAYHPPHLGAGTWQGRTRCLRSEMNFTSPTESLPKTSLKSTVILHLIAHSISQIQT